MEAKMKRTFWSSIFLSAILISTSVFAECDKHSPDPPVIKGVEVESNISVDDSTGIYSYNYTLKNGEESTGCLWKLEIDITKPDNSIDLTDEGLVDYPRYITKDLVGKSRAPQMVPVAFPDLPRGTVPELGMGEVTVWDAGLTVRGTASWGSVLGQYIPPGEEESGFIMTSYGIPTVRDFTAKPRYIAKDQDVYNMGVSKEEFIKDSFKYLEAFYDSIAYTGKTIGPTAPPLELDPASFLQGIIDMKHEAYSLGWITDAGIENSLDVKLENALKKLKSGNSKSAKNILGAFINEVEAQGCETYDDCKEGKHLKPEAYALLKYNAQYLINNMGD
jgi:hypothetical protein